VRDVTGLDELPVDHALGDELDALLAKEDKEGSEEVDTALPSCVRFCPCPRPLPLSPFPFPFPSPLPFPLPWREMRCHREGQFLQVYHHIGSRDRVAERRECVG
jgi:hypothetical protein